LRIKEQETRPTLQEHDDYDDFVVNILEGEIFGKKRPWEDLEIDATHG